MKGGLLSALVFAGLAAMAMVPQDDGGAFEPLVGPAAGKLCGNGPLSRPRS